MTHPDSPLLWDERDGVLELTLNRPRDANTVNLALARTFRDAVARAESMEVRVVIITGAGDTFCGGGDVREMAQAADMPAYLAELAGTFHDGLERLSQLDAVLIAAVDGAAAGGGLGLALNADVILASPRAMFLTAYEAVGLTPDSGTSFLLPLAVGLPVALDMSATGRRLDAEAARGLGLVSAIHPSDEILDAARTLGRQLASRQRAGMAETRRLYRRDVDGAYRGHLAEETRTIAQAARRDETQCAIRAFAGRRRTGDPK